MHLYVQFIVYAVIITLSLFSAWPHTWFTWWAWEFFLFFFGHSAQPVGISVPWPEAEPRPQESKCQTPTSHWTVREVPGLWRTLISLLHSKTWRPESLGLWPRFVCLSPGGYKTPPGLRATSPTSPRNYSLLPLMPIYLRTEFLSRSGNYPLESRSVSQDWAFSEEGHPLLGWMWLFPNQQSTESCLLSIYKNLIFRGHLGAF